MPAIRSNPTPDQPLVIGWSELIDLPDWGIVGLRAKIDTGARSTALHVDGMTPLGRNRVSFRVPVRKRPSDRIIAEVVRRSRVRSSNGHFSQRLFVRTHLRLGNRCRAVELNLVDRSGMLFPMLVGRTALAGWYLVDPGHRRLVSKKAKPRPTS